MKWYRYFYLGPFTLYVYAAIAIGFILAQTPLRGTGDWVIGLGCVVLYCRAIHWGFQIVGILWEQNYAEEYHQKGHG